MSSNLVAKSASSASTAASDCSKCRIAFGPSGPGGASIAHAWRQNASRLLAVNDPDRAAYIFTWLVISIAANRVAFLGDSALDPPDELIAQADEAARVFLAAYGAEPPTSNSSRRHTTRARRG